MALFNYIDNYPSIGISPILLEKESSLSSQNINTYKSQLLDEGIIAIQSQYDDPSRIYNQFKYISEQLGQYPITDANRRKKDSLQDDTKTKLSSVDLDFSYVNPHSETSFSPARPNLIAFVCLDISEKGSSEGLTTLIDGEYLWSNLDLNLRKDLASRYILYKLEIELPKKRKKLTGSREWYLDFSNITNTLIDYDKNVLKFEYFCPFITENPITKKLALANHCFVDLETEPQIISRDYFRQENKRLIETNVPNEILADLNKSIKTLKWKKGLSIFIDNYRYMHGRLSYDMSEKRNIYIKQYRRIRF